MGESAVRDRIRECSGWLTQRQLGRGQYGTAYLVGSEKTETGKDGTEISSEFAVAKVVGLEFLPEKEHQIAFQEVELMRDLRHPNIVSLKDHFFTEAQLELVIVMEFCDAGDLRGEVKKRAAVKPTDHIPEDTLMIWFVQLTLALNYIHHRHILHRDLKSSNIFMTSSEDKSRIDGLDVKIGDFGISRVLEGTVDVAATVVGTPYYMSPEVCKAEPYGYKSDIWALGCVLYEMCMLKHAFESQSLLGLVYKIVSETYDPIPQQYSADLRTLMERVLDKSWQTRPSGKEVLDMSYVKGYSQTAPVEKGVRIDAQPAVPKTNSTGSKPPPPRTSLGTTLNAQKKNARVQPLGSAMRIPEASPLPPDATLPIKANDAVGSSLPEEQQRRRWNAPSAGVPPAPASNKQLDEGEFRAQVLLGRIRRALAVRRQNWLQVFASFDHVGDGRLPEAEFDRAITSMALGLSDQEIKEVRGHLLLQSGGTCVPVDLFGKALHGTSPEVQKSEAWGRSTLSELSREAAKASGGANAAGPGARVQVKGLQSAVGVKLNGSEGVVDRWDATSSRWVVRLDKGELKSIRDEHLHIVRPAPSSSGPVEQDTTAIYRLLCEGGETAVPEANFLGAVKQLLPKLGETEWRRLLLLLPKSSDGRIDVPEVLNQFLVCPLSGQGDQTINIAGPLFPQATAGGAAGGSQAIPGPDFGASPMSPTRAAAPRPSPPPRRGGSSPAPAQGPQPNHIPGSVQSPTANAGFGSGGRRVAPASAVGGGGGGASSSTADARHAEVALLRLSQKLIGRGSSPGPGVDLLRLFAAQPDEVRVEELNEAVSVSPLGISRAEVQSIFAHLGSSDVVSLGTLIAAIEAAYKAGTPAEAALDGLNPARLAGALTKLDAASGGSGRATIPEFRCTICQAEPYLTANQLEWLTALTDKDGEGRLLPRTLLVRLGANTANVNRGGMLMVPPRPAGASRGQIASHARRGQVAAAILARIRDRLFSAGPQLTLERVLSIFEVGTDRGASTSRETLACLLGHMRLGISVAEADELVSSLVGSAGASTVHLTALYDALQRGGELDQEALVDELRDAVRDRFLGRASQFAEAAARCGGDWLPESEFRWCLAQALVDEGIQSSPMETEEEDRAMLLSEKSASGTVRWRQFATTYLGWHDDDYYSDPGLASPKKGGTMPAASNTQQTWHQTWRSGKTVPERTVIVVTSPEKAKSFGQMKEPPPDAPLKIPSEAPPRRKGPCHCLTRLFGGGGKAMAI